MAKASISTTPLSNVLQKQINEMSISDLETLVTICDDISINEENSIVSNFFFALLNYSMKLLTQKRAQAKENNNVK